MREDKLQRFMMDIGYPFKTFHLLEQALSHRSSGKENNELLEFLGDSIVNFIIAEELFRQFPLATEGQLSRIRANLVSGETLSMLAKKIQLGEMLRLGVGEIKSGGASRASILADAMEALIGAIYLDSDMTTCAHYVKRWYADYLKEVSLENVQKDPKSLLQELVQAKKLPLPEYELVKVEGEEHDQSFVMNCRVVLLESPAIGRGKSRRKAEQDAAEEALRLLDEWK